MPLYDVSVALAMLALAALLLYLFRLPLARWVGSTKHAASAVKQEVIQAFHEGTSQEEKD